ncbi:hypothetical protein STCU_12229 [Strigomonas culicis]|uniref:Uncharacterized protein n=1 Tax=Strigomonas culicis TaxID=28005 RepID=S9TE38_9TRYP|nr:hypothetical protein STCU_12229 [Strigomonas culicis]|eukprot:EPY15224.1 hypothetical protein STCU_12229 [Strigomonas culicis]
MLLETFSLSMEHFLAHRWQTDSALSAKEGTPEDSEAVLQSLERVLVGLHTEFGLPRSAHHTGHAWVEHEAALRDSFPVPTDANEAVLYTHANKQWWTQAQCLLFGNSQLFRCAYLLREIFS